MPRPELVEQLKRHEGYRKHPYKCPAGYWTIGYGHCLSRDTEISYWDALELAGGVWDIGRAEQELADDIKIYSFELETRLPWLRALDDARRDALINMAFNLGVPGLIKFRHMLAALQLRDWDKAAEEALNSKWAMQVGRRARELSEQLRTGR